MNDRIDIPNLEIVDLPDSFEKVTSRSVTSIYMNMNEWIDVSPILAKLLPFALDDIDVNSTSIHIWNVSYTITESFDFSRFSLVESIEIGDDCFSNVNGFMIDGLNELKSLKIWSKSFSTVQSANDWDYDSVEKDCSRSFSILNCVELGSIDIGRFSFVAFGNKFELVNLPKLSTIKIGSIETDRSESNDNGWSLNFYFCSFKINGI